MLLPVSQSTEDLPMTQKTGRNDPCPCGSGKKYKSCCWGKDHQKKVGFSATQITSQSHLFKKVASELAGGLETLKARVKELQQAPLPEETKENEKGEP